MSNTIAVFPGSFDPPTFGHINIIHRCTKIFDSLHVVVASRADKHYMFSPEERLAMITELTKQYPKTSATRWEGLIVDFVQSVGAKVIVRGVRPLGDFEYEFELSMINRGLNSTVETVLIPTDPKYFALRTSGIKELARLGGDISAMVPPLVSDKLNQKISEKR